MPNIIVNLYKESGSREDWAPVAQFRMEVDQTVYLNDLNDALNDALDKHREYGTDFFVTIDNYDTLQESAPDTFEADAETVLRALDYID